jgi:hypothetical protein
MSTNVQEEKTDYIYQRLRTQITKLESSTISQPSVFFVFGASVNLNHLTSSGNIFSLG